MAVIRALADWFPFNKPSSLPDAFPASAAGAGQPLPRELSRSVQLVHQAYGPAELSPGFAGFQFVGPAGQAQVVLSETPSGRVQYVEAFHAFHNDPVARQILIFIQEVNTLQTIGLQNSFVDIAGGVIATGQVYPLRRSIFVPEGFALGATAVGLAAGQVVTLVGMTVVTNRAETPPPLY